MADRLELDINDLTLEDLEKLEEAAGRPAGKIIADFDSDNLQVKDLIALVYVIRSRTDPDFTLDDARKIKITELVVEDDVDPPAGAVLGAAS